MLLNYNQRLCWSCIWLLQLSRLCLSEIKCHMLLEIDSLSICNIHIHSTWGFMEMRIINSIVFIHMPILKAYLHFFWKLKIIVFPLTSYALIKWILSKVFVFKPLSRSTHMKNMQSLHKLHWIYSYHINIHNKISYYKGIGYCCTPTIFTHEKFIATTKIHAL